MTERSVVVGINGSLTSVRALDEAAAAAARRGAVLRVAYAVRDADEAGPVLNAALDRVRRRHPRLRAVPVVAVGDPVQVLERLGADAALTVVGSRGLNEAAGRLLGSVSRRLATRRGVGPLMVVRGERPAGAEVVLAEASATDVEAAVFAFEEAELRNAPLRVLRAVRLPVPMGLSVRGLWSAAEGAGLLVTAARTTGPTAALLQQAACPVVLVPSAVRA
ncbi:universal stress protein [Streptomyces sp. NPDC051940]|uniref:universal stress protein n=1 Tax=Streptomyces sp. NPDC051940 TaxID=3155675 RepID=UPI00343551BA